MKYLVLPTQKAVQAFRRECAMMSNCDYDITEIASEIFKVLSYRHDSRQGIDRLRQTYGQLHSANQSVADMDGEILAGAIGKLAYAMEDVIETHNLYDSTGLFHYCFYEWMGDDMAFIAH